MKEEIFSGDPALDLMSKYAPRRGMSIEKMIRQYILDGLKRPARICEFGAGRGEFIFRFLGEKDLDLYATEIDKTYKDILSRSVKTFESLDQIQGQLDGIFLIDVLEHIEDDRKTLRELYNKLNKGGRLLIYVPARMEIYSKFDSDVGHFRRYTLKELKGKVSEAGFTVKKARYHELLSYFAAGAAKILKRNDQLNVGSVKFYNSVILPTTTFIESIIPPPVGKSIYLYAVKG